MAHEDNRVSTKDLLIRQVEEQSRFCDFTVKRGNWEKRFHRCVLAASPYFEKMFKHEFVEQKKGFVELSVGTPVTVEMALMFLYGTLPNFTLENAKYFFEIADYLLIPNLKAALIKFLHKIEITHELCLDILHFCALYDVNLSNFNRFIEGHLTEMFLLPQMLHVSDKSMEYILSDGKLSYVPTDDKLRFLFKWIEHDIEIRKPFFKELIKLIDLTEASRSVVGELKGHPVAIECDELKTVETPACMYSTTETRNVIVIAPEISCKHCFLCYDNVKLKWYRLASPAYQAIKPKHMFDEIQYLGGKMSSGQCWFSTDDFLEVHCINLVLDSCTTYDIAQNLTDEEDQRHFSDLVCCGETIFASFNSWFTSMPTIYRGFIKNDKIALSPVFSLRNDMISMCVNENLTLFILLEDCCLAYDLEEHTLERISIAMQFDAYMYELRPATEGAIVFNRNKCYCISRLSGPSLSKKYLVKELSFDHANQELHNMHKWYKYEFSADIFFRLPYQNSRENSQLEFATYDNFMNAITFSDINWSRLPLPSSVIECYVDIFNHHFFQMRIPKDKLSCDVDCPHCDETSHRSRNDEIYYSSSDDESHYNDGYYSLNIVN